MVASKSRTKRRAPITDELVLTTSNLDISRTDVERLLSRSNLPIIPKAPPMVVGILGDPGAGKTTLLTGIGVEEWLAHGTHLIANYHLKNVPYSYLHLEDIAHHTKDIFDAFVLVTELSTEADSYQFFSANATALSDLVSQLRKQRCRLFYDDQRKHKIAKRIRSLTNNTISVEGTDYQGIMRAQMLDEYDRPIGDETLIDGRVYFDFFDTEERIIGKGDDDDNG